VVIFILDSDVIQRSVRIARATGMTSFSDVMMLLSKYGIAKEVPPEVEVWESRSCPRRSWRTSVAESRKHTWSWF